MTSKVKFIKCIDAEKSDGELAYKIYKVYEEDKNFYNIRKDKKISTHGWYKHRFVEIGSNKILEILYS